MPELPEVTTIVNQLKPYVIGKKIDHITCKVPKMCNLSNPKLNKLASGKRIKNIYRRSKIIVIELNNNYYLHIHLKMSGQFLLYNDSHKPDKHTHIIIDLEGPKKIYFREVRKFGYIKLFSKKESIKELSKLGPEPLESVFTFNKFQQIIKTVPRSTIKQLLTNINKIAGIGNIYANEILFCAKVRPSRKNKTITKNELQKIYNCIHSVLKRAVTEKGTSDTDYIDAFGKKGNYEKLLKVYRRQGNKCLSCKNGIIKRIVVGGRGTFYCPHCQK